MQPSKDIYNTIASHFSATRDFYWDLEELIQYTKKGDRVLDVGCGNGRLYHVLEPIGVSYVGLDQSEELIKIAKEKKSGGEFVVGEMQALPFPDASFHIIYCIRAFHHLPDVDSRLKSLKEMKRVLKSGGTLVMMNWHIYGEYTKEKIASGETKEIGNGDFLVPWKSSTGEVLGERYYHGFALLELLELFEKVGLRVEEQYFIKKRGQRSDEKEGENIVSVVISQ